MGEIYYNQILILLFQCITVALLLLGVFKLRSIFGLSLLFTTLGVFQYLQVFLVNALYFEISPGILVSSGSAVLFTGSLFAILLVYIKEDALEARKVIYAILSANIVLSILQYVITLGFESEKIVNIYNIPKELFILNIRVLIVGTLLLFLDTFFIIFIYEFVSKYIKTLFFRIALSMIFILSIDSILFPIGAFSNSDQIQQIIFSGLISKNLAAIVYAFIFTLYIKFVDKEKIILGAYENRFNDIFNSLTFRAKYEITVAENKSQRKSINQYQHIVSTSTDLMAAIDKNFKYLTVNLAYAAAFNETPGQMIGKSLIDVFGKDVYSNTIKTCAENCLNGETVDYEEWIDFPKLGKRYMNIKYFPYYNENSQIDSFIVNARDITEKKLAENALKNEKALFKAILDNIPVLITLYDPKISMLYFNKEFETKIGYTTKEANEVDFFEKIYATKSLQKQARDFMLSGSKSWKEFPIISKIGKTINSEWTNIILNNGTQIGIGLDITHRKKAEKALKIALEKATESDRLKTAFLQNISHEIRTPMNGILGFTNLLKNPDLSDEKSKVFIDIITKSGNRMLNTLNDLMDISKLETGQVHIMHSKINVDKELRMLYEFFKPEAESKNLILNLNKSVKKEDLILESDREKLYATLSNLIKNAIKYCDKGRIDFGYEFQDNFIEFYVKDTGIGISKIKQQSIFKRFIQANNNYSNGYDGAGLGLSISKSYVEMLGGEIWVISKEGEGSSFYFTIPIKN